MPAYGRTAPLSVLNIPRSPARGMVAPSMKMEFPTPVNTIKIIPARHTQRPVSQVILEYRELIINSSHQSHTLRAPGLKQLFNCWALSFSQDHLGETLGTGYIFPGLTLHSD